VIGYRVGPGTSGAITEREEAMAGKRKVLGFFTTVFLGALVATLSGQGDSIGVRMDGKRLFERETFEAYRVPRRASYVSQATAACS
jgi:hypothetical protein